MSVVSSGSLARRRTATHHSISRMVKSRREQRTQRPVLPPQSHDEDQGYPESAFVTPLESFFKCPICQDVLRDATQACSEQHMFCKSCLAQHRQHSSTCPVCRRPIEEREVVSQVGIERWVSSQPTRCPQGCSWTGAFSERDDHLRRECKKVSRNCPNSTGGCTASPSLATLDDHLARECKHRYLICPRGGMDCGGKKKGRYFPEDEEQHAEACLQHKCSVDFACYTRGSLEQLTVHEPGCFELRKKCGDLGVRCSDLSDKCAELGREYNVLHRRYKTLQEEHVTVCDEETTLRAEKDAAIKEVEELKIKLAEAHRTKRGSSPLELPPSKRVANEEDQALASLPSIEVLSYDAGSTTDHDKLAEMSNSVQQFLQGGASPPFAEP